GIDGDLLGLTRLIGQRLLLALAVARRTRRRTSSAWHYRVAECAEVEAVRDGAGAGSPSHVPRPGRSSRSLGAKPRYPPAPAPPRDRHRADRRVLNHSSRSKSRQPAPPAGRGRPRIGAARSGAGWPRSALGL